jgi:hypothetical protein
MPKVTQNRVYCENGSCVRLDGSADSYVAFLSKFNALRYVQATVKETTPEGKTIEKPVFNEDGTPKMVARPRSGYTQYFNNDGFTNPISPEALTPQGVGKLMAKLLEVAHMTMRAGGAKAEEMKTVLDGAFAYHAVADVEVAKAADNTAMEEALSVLKKAAKGDAAAAQAKLSEFLKSKGITAPAPVIQEPSVTVAEAATAAAETVDEPQDAAPVDTVETVADETVEVPTETEAELAADVTAEEPTVDEPSEGEAVAVAAEPTDEPQSDEPQAVDTALTVEQQ